MMREWRRRLRGTFSRRERIGEELREELNAHLAMEVEANLAAGMAPDAARRDAQRRFGNAAAIQERAADSWTLPRLETLGQDVRYGARMLRRTPGLTIVAIVSLALGIGAGTAIFSVAEAMMFRTLAVSQPEQLVVVRTDDPWHDTPNYGVPYQMFEHGRELDGFFTGIANDGAIDRSNVTILAREGGAAGTPDPGTVHLSLVSGNYFPLLGVQAALGRLLTPSDDLVQGNHPVAVISFRYWQRRLGGDGDAVGRAFQLNGTTYAIVGVMPRNFEGEWVGRPTDIWIPSMMRAQVVPERPFRNWGVTLIGRLRPGASRSAAQAAAQVLFQRVRAEMSGLKPWMPAYREFASYRVTLESMAAGYSPQRVKFAQPLTILAVIVGLVLLIACANVSNLLLARGRARRREMAVRLAIGAGRGRIVRQLLTESLLLAAAGGAAGVAVAYWGTGVLGRIVQSGPAGFNAPAMAIEMDLHPNTAALLFTGALCLLTGLLFGLAPAWRSARESLTPSLSERGAAAGGQFLGKALVMGQVAASLLLLTGAGLFVRTLYSLKTQNLGLDRDHLLLVWTAPMQTGRTGAVVAPLFEKTRERVGALPGVVSASASVYGLLNGNSFVGSDVKVQGFTPRSGATPAAQLDIVLPGYFETLGMRVLTGRDFDERDTTQAPRVIIVNQSLANYFFPGENPVGKRIGFGGNAAGNEYEIVGVVSDALHITPRDRGRMMHYKPYRQDIGHLLQMCVAVRTSGEPARMAAAIRRELRAMDATLPIVRIETIDQQLDDLLGPERLIAALSGFLGAVALILVCVGLYGLVSYTMLRRTNEIGIRIALGATRAGVIGMVLRDSFRMVTAGTAIGLPATVWATRLVASRLYDVRPGDARTIAGAIAVMLVVAAVAAWAPARRSSKVDPMAALRAD